MGEESPGLDGRASCVAHRLVFDPRSATGCVVCRRPAANAPVTSRAPRKRRIWIAPALVGALLVASATAELLSRILAPAKPPPIAAPASPPRTEAPRAARHAHAPEAEHAQPSTAPAAETPASRTAPDGPEPTVDARSAWPTDGLAGAAVRGDLAAITESLAAHVEIDAQDAEGTTALAWAIVAKQPQVAGVLLKHGASVEIAASDGTTPLMLAAEAGLQELTASLIDIGAHVSRADRLGRTALMHAARADQAATALVLLARGADVRARDHRGRSALHHAAETGAGAATLDRLLEHGAPIDAPDARGATALHVAAGEGHADGVRALLDRHASLNARASGDRSALDFVVMPREPLPESVRQGRLLMLDLLIRRGIDRRLGVNPASTPILFRPILDGLAQEEGRAALPAFGATDRAPREELVAVGLPLLEAVPPKNSWSFPPWSLPGAMAASRGWSRVPNIVRQAKLYGASLRKGQIATLSGDAEGREPWEVDDGLLVEAVTGTRRLDSGYAGGGAYDLSIDGRTPRRLGRIAWRFAPGSVDVTSILRQRPERVEFTVFDCGGSARVSPLFLRIEGPHPEQALIHAKVEPRVRRPAASRTAAPVASLRAAQDDPSVVANAPLNRRLAAARKAVPITVYRTQWCGPCQRASEYLHGSGLSFIERDVERDPSARATARALNPRGSVPTIDVGGQVLVGWSPEHFEGLLDQVAQSRAR